MDKQLSELNGRFSNQVVDLLTLSSSLVPKNCFKAFDVEKIQSLVEKYYPCDFTEQEKISLVYQLEHYILDVCSHPELNKLSTMVELCRGLVATEKSIIYYLVYRLIRLILTLPISTATTERAFPAMKIIKTRLRNKMEDDFLRDNLIVFIEREIAESFSTDSIIEDFKNEKERRGLL